MEEKVKKEPEFYEEDEIDLYELWLTIKKRKKLIIGLFLFITISTAIISFILTPVYRSEASVIPVSAASSPLGELAGLAAMAGFSVGSTGDSAKIMAILKSRSIKEAVIKDIDLIPVLLEEDIPEDRDPMNVAVETLDEMVSVSEDKKTGVITISIDYKDPELAKKIAEKYIEKLQEIMNEKSLTIARFNRLFLEKRLKEEERKLEKIQSKLADFQKKTKIIQPSQQLEGVMDLYSNLIAKKIELIVKLRSVEAAFSEDNPKVKSLKEQLKAVSQQIKDLEGKTNIAALPSLSQVPEKLIEYENLMRELKVSEEVYETLVKMYEQARLKEAKENIYVEVIDPPSLPDKPVKPKKKLMVAVAGVSSLFLGVFLAFFLEWIENVKRRHRNEL
ncbi:GumC family protein [Persephonella sp.]